MSIIEPCLRKIGEKDRIFPKARRIEVVFLVEAVNYLLLRTEGQGYINAITLPESKLEVPVILPQKLQAVVRRKLLHILREHYSRDPQTVMDFVKKAAELGFTKAVEHLNNGWNCTIQPPVAESGEKATDLGMDGYCPACTIFGAALTSDQIKMGKRMSIGVKTRVHFDPAFATRRGIVPSTHNKVSEGLLSTTGQALYPEVHVEPGTVFVGRAVLTELTASEFLAVLGSLARVEEIGGRAGVYGTVRIHLLGVRCGKHSLTTALELAEELVRERKSTISEAKAYLSNKLSNLGFGQLNIEAILEATDPARSPDNFKKLWASSIEYAEQMVKWICTLDPKACDMKEKAGRRSSKES